MLIIKKIRLLGTTNTKYNKTDFVKLEEFLATQNSKFSLKEFMHKGVLVKKHKGYLHLTYLGKLFKDDQNLSIKINGVLVKGPLYSIFLKTVDSLISDSEETKRIQSDNATRKTITDLIGADTKKVIREAVSNLIVHSHFKNLIDTSMEVLIGENDVQLINYHSNGELSREFKANGGKLPPHAHNPSIFNAMRLLKLSEGEGSGFDIFIKYKNLIEIEITHDKFIFKIKGAI